MTHSEESAPPPEAVTVTLRVDRATYDALARAGVDAAAALEAVAAVDDPAAFVAYRGEVPEDV